MKEIQDKVTEVVYQSMTLMRATDCYDAQHKAQLLDAAVFELQSSINKYLDWLREQCDQSTH